MNIPVIVDPASKAVSIEQPYLDSIDPSKVKELNNQVAQLNDLARHLVGVNGDVPPPSNVVTESVTKQVNKLKDSAAKATKAGRGSEAIKFYNLAMGLALKRAPWESTQYVIEEVCSILGPRADLYISQSLWPEAYTDSGLLVLLKGMDPKNQYRKGRCLQTIGKLSEARIAYQTALNLQPQNSEFKSALQEVDGLIEKKD